MNNELFFGIGMALGAINFLLVLWVAFRLGTTDAEKHRYRDACGLKEVVIERRLALLEQIAATLPTHRDLNDIRSGIGVVAMDLAGVRERLIVNTEMTRSIKKHLLENE